MDIESERERAEKKLGRDNVRKESGFERDREKQIIRVMLC